MGISLLGMRIGVEGVTMCFTISREPRHVSLGFVYLPLRDDLSLSFSLSHSGISSSYRCLSLSSVSLYHFRHSHSRSFPFQLPLRLTPFAPNLLGLSIFPFLPPQRSPNHPPIPPGRQPNYRTPLLPLPLALPRLAPGGLGRDLG